MSSCPPGPGTFIHKIQDFMPGMVWVERDLNSRPFPWAGTLPPAQIPYLGII